jgi:hypothetical protein
MVNWTTILNNQQSISVIQDFAREHICAKTAAANLDDIEAKRTFNGAVKQHRTAYTRVLARKALRRRGIIINE